jgi:hypothetical protein
MPQNIFDFDFEFAEIFEFESGSAGVSYPAEHFQDRGLFKHGYYKPLVVKFIHADNFRKVSL